VVGGGSIEFCTKIYLSENYLSGFCSCDPSQDQNGVAGYMKEVRRVGQKKNDQVLLMLLGCLRDGMIKFSPFGGLGSSLER